MKQLTKENLRTITKSSGIYYIKAYECNYVGSTRSLKKRLLEHLNTLKKNKHDNPRMQNIFNKYGIKEFYFSILEVHASWDQKYLLEREEFWIDTLGPTLNNKLTPTNQQNCKTTGKTVYQFNLIGERLREYPSCNEAERQTGIVSSSIASCARGKLLSAGGFLWSYQKDVKITYNLERSKWKWKAVEMINLQTNIHTKYQSISDATRAIFEDNDNFDSLCASISSVCRGHGKHVKKIYTFQYI